MKQHRTNTHHNSTAPTTPTQHKEHQPGKTSSTKHKTTHQTLPSQNARKRATPQKRPPNQKTSAHYHTSTRHAQSPHTRKRPHHTRKTAQPRKRTITPQLPRHENAHANQNKNFALSNHFQNRHPARVLRAHTRKSEQNSKHPHAQENAPQLDKAKTRAFYTAPHNQPNNHKNAPRHRTPNSQENAHPLPHLSLIHI